MNQATADQLLRDTLRIVLNAGLTVTDIDLIVDDVVHEAEEVTPER